MGSASAKVLTATRFPVARWPALLPPDEKRRPSALSAKRKGTACSSEQPDMMPAIRIGQWQSLLRSARISKEIPRLILPRLNPLPPKFFIETRNPGCYSMQNNFILLDTYTITGRAQLRQGPLPNPCAGGSQSSPVEQFL
jgi:hypothetical protein